MVHSWDPDRYLAFADERGRPFLELVSRVRAQDPASVVDLGAGPGTLTSVLHERWPAARVLAVDSSAEMIERARGVEGIEVQQADLRDWAPQEPVDVLVSNAALQWVPGHLALLPRLVGSVRPGGWFAMQVPGNFEEPSHALRRELAAHDPYREHLQDLVDPSSHDAATYLRALRDLDCEVDAWETTYLHVLHGEDPVFDWVSGTGARPTLQALPGDLRERFSVEFRALLREAYPASADAVVLPFRRIFAVARRR